MGGLGVCPGDRATCPNGRQEIVHVLGVAPLAPQFFPLGGATLALGTQERAEGTAA